MHHIHCLLLILAVTAGFVLLPDTASASLMPGTFPTEPPKIDFEPSGELGQIPNPIWRYNTAPVPPVDPVSPVQGTNIPEPSSYVLIGTAIGTLLYLRSRWDRQAG